MKIDHDDRQALEVICHMCGWKAIYPGADGSIRGGRVHDL